MQKSLLPISIISSFELTHKAELKGILIISSFPINNNKRTINQYIMSYIKIIIKKK